MSEINQPVDELDILVEDNELTESLENSFVTVGEQPKLSADEIVEKMGHCSYQFDQASQVLVALKKRMLIAQSKARTLILAKRWHLLTNTRLVAHLEVIFADSKYKPSATDLSEFVYLETVGVAEPYEVAEQIAKQASKQYDFYQGQLMWYMSKNKRDTAEFLALNHSRDRD